MTNKPIHLLFKWWIESVKNKMNEKEYNYIIRNFKFDEQNLPIDNYYRRNMPNYSDDLIEKIVDLNPSLDMYIEMLEYDENGYVLRKQADEESKYIFKSEGFEHFQNVIQDKWELTIREEDKHHEIQYVLESIFTSVLQEYSDTKDGIFSIISEKLDFETLNNILDKHLDFFNKKNCEVEIIIPVSGAIWINNQSSKDLFEKIEDNMNIRLITKEEQTSRVYFSETQLGIFEKEKDFFESKYDLNRSNIAISIREKVYVKNLLNYENDTINKIYEKYHLKVNTILNLISLNEMDYNLTIENMYYKCDSYPFSYHVSPITKWNKVLMLPRDIIKLSSKGYFQKPVEINNDLVKKIINEYTNIVKASSGNSECIQGAFLRRTRARMDLNETEGLLDSIIGIEQLFSSGQSSELTFRISLYICNILFGSQGFENQSKKDIFTEFKDLYKLRSSFVHSGKKVSNERGLFYLTSLLKQIINSNKFNLELKESISEQTQNMYLFIENK